MKLAEALAARADAQKSLEQLRARAVSVARFQEDETPAEDAMALHAEALSTIRQLENLVRRINRTNSVTTMANGMTITEAIAKRDALATERKVTSELADAAAGKDHGGYFARRTMRSELRLVTNVPVSQLRADADRIARDYRELDTRIQEANWTTELVAE